MEILEFLGGVSILHFSGFILSLAIAYAIVRDKPIINVLTEVDEAWDEIREQINGMLGTIEENRHLFDEESDLVVQAFSRLLKRSPEDVLAALERLLEEVSNEQTTE